MTLEEFKSNPRTMYTAEEYERILRAKEEAEAMLLDDSMRELAEEEIRSLEADGGKCGSCPCRGSETEKPHS
jgi:hypothetical protein